MKAKILLIAVLLTGALKGVAQNDVALATLQHGNNVSVFKGPGALANALAAASDEGDNVITLSQGTFTATQITKPVSIYGAGFETDDTKGTMLTKISGDLTVGKGNSYTTLSNVHLEGFYLDGEMRVGGDYNSGPLENLRVVKVKAKSMFAWSTSSNTSFDQCVILGSFDCDRAGGANGIYDFYFSNCIMSRGSFRYYKMTGSSIVLDHCLFNANNDANITGGTPFYGSHNDLLTLKNSIYVKASGSGTVYGWPAGSDIQGCISDMSISGFDNCYQVALANIFEDGEDGTYSPDRTYVLNPEQSSEWIGTDGTEIGLHGGNGWSKVPSTPVVKNLSVTPDGTNLNVTYEAEVR